MSFFYDIKHSVKSLCNNLKYTVTTILTMGLTLTIALFLFTIVYTVEYKPLPDIEKPEEIVWGTLTENGDTNGVGGLTNYTFSYVKQHQSKLDFFGRAEERVVTLSNASMVEKLSGVAVSYELFPLLGLTPFKGRTFIASDDVYGAQKNIIISYNTWERLFNKSDDILAQTVKLNGEMANIIGVMPQGFRFPVNHDVWFTDSLVNLGAGDHAGWNSFYGRLKPGARLSDVQAEVDIFSQQMKNEYPNQYNGKGIAVSLFTNRFAEGMSFLVNIIKIASISILLMGCFSVINLIIVRNLENAKNILIKSALGIPRVHIIKSLMLETLIICMSAFFIGICFCLLIINHFGGSLLEGPYWWVLKFESSTLILGVILSLLIWLITAIVPIWMAIRRPTNGLLSSGRKGGGSGVLNHVMSVFSIIQIFGAFILIVLTGVLIGAIIRLINIDYGVPRGGYLTAEVKLAGPKYQTLDQRIEYYQRFIDLSKQVSGIQASAVSGALPGSWGYLANYTSSQRNIEINGGFPKALEMPISEGYLSLMHLNLIEGRNFNAADKEGSDEVAIINETMAKILFPSESPVGRKFQYDPENNGKLITIVGVVPDVIGGDPLWFLSEKGKDWRSQLYRPILQTQPEWDSNTLVFKVNSDPYELASAIKSIANNVDGNVPLYNIKSYDDLLAENEIRYKSLIYTFAPAAVLSLIVSVLGIYSITRRVVLQRIPDIGVMRAIGIQEKFINRKYLSVSIFQLLIALFAGTLFSLIFMPLLPDSIVVTDGNTNILACFFTSVLISILVVIASYIPLLSAHKLSPKEAMNFLSLNGD